MIFCNGGGMLRLELTGSSSQKDIMDVQCDLLVSDFKNLSTMAQVQTSIKEMFDGSFPHRAAPLRCGLEKAFELKKKKRERNGVVLRCITSYCGGYRKPVPRIATSTNYCQRCACSLACAGCGYRRTNHNLTCERCGKYIL